MEQAVIWVKVHGYEKYRARKDIKEPWWFKVSNKLFTDDDLDHLNLEELAAWVYILSVQSKQKDPIVGISVRKATEARVPLAVLESAISKLAEAGVVSRVPGRIPDAICTDPVRDSPGSRAAERDLEENEKRVETAPEDAAAALWITFALKPGAKVHTALNQKRAGFNEALSCVSPDIQLEWLERYQVKSLRQTLTDAFEYGSAERTTNWARFFVAWVKREKKTLKPAPKPKPPGPYQPEPPFDPAAEFKPFDVTPEAERKILSFSGKPA